MKPIKIILSMACASLMLSACTDLDERIFDKVPMDNYGKTESEIQTITAAVYASLRGLSDATTGINSYPTCEFVFFLDEAASDEACIPAVISSMRHVFPPESFRDFRIRYAGIHLPYSRKG